MNAKKLKTTSVDSKLPTQARFEQSLQDAINCHESILSIGYLQYVAQYKTQSPISHSRIAYKVIHRNTGCSVLIKLTRVLNVGSGLRKQQKFNRHERRMVTKWIPRLKTRY
jgi:uncharacterized protein YerC